MTTDGDRPRPLERVALRFTDLSERWLPDAFIFALMATVVVVIAGLTAGGASPRGIAMAWGKGFWSLIPFTMQMALIVITGTVVATAAPVQRFIDRIAGIPQSNRSAVVFVAVISMVTSWFNWGFSLVFSAVLVRAVARRLPSVDYRTLAACSLLGLGSVWAQGLSGSAALQMATPGMLPDGIREIVAGGGAAGRAGTAGTAGHGGDDGTGGRDYSTDAYDFSVAVLDIRWDRDRCCRGPYRDDCSDREQDQDGEPAWD